MATDTHRPLLAAATHLLAALFLAAANAQRPQPFGDAALAAHLDAARERTLSAAAAAKLPLPADFLAWIDADPMRKASVYGCRSDALPVLAMLRSLELDLGTDIVRRDYESLALAFAIQSSYSPPRASASAWNDGDDQDRRAALPDLSPRPPLVLQIPGDPRQPVDTKASNRELDLYDHLINFLEDHAPIEVEVMVDELPPLVYDERGIAKPRGKAERKRQTVRRALVAADVIASAALQQELRDYLRERGHDGVLPDCGDQAVHWHATAAVGDADLRRRIAAAHELFHAAYRNKGRMPAERDRAPSPAESMAWLIRNDRSPLGAADRKARGCGPFSLQAPWPLLLMLAADDQPLREREAIWRQFADEGIFRSYGEYIGGIAQQFDMQSARRLAPLAFSYGSIQMMWKDGGVCGTMGNIGARSYRICGVPASTAGQPGHCAIVYFEHDEKTGEFRCRGGQYATGGDEVTTVHAGWNYDERGGRRPMVFHQSVAFGINHGSASYIDMLVLQRILAALPATEQATMAESFYRAALARNPFALPCLLAAIAAADTAERVLALFAAHQEVFGSRAEQPQYVLYHHTVRDLVHARLLELPDALNETSVAELLPALERQGCQHMPLLARCWRLLGGEEEFLTRCRAEVLAYVALPEKERNRPAAEAFASRVAALQGTIRGKAKQQAWAKSLLEVFAGKDRILHRNKPQLDPTVLALCKLAGVPPPAIQ